MLFNVQAPKPVPGPVTKRLELSRGVPCLICTKSSLVNIFEIVFLSFKNKIGLKTII